MENPRMIQPKHLEPGDSVALVALASPPKENDDLQRAVRIVENLGLSPVVAPHASARYRYLAGSDGERVEDLHWAFRDERINGVLCIRGGYGTLRLLPLIDWSLLMRRPKVLVGMSDITALQLAALKGPLMTFSGPMPLMAEGDRMTDFSKEQFWAAVGAAGGDGVIRTAPGDPKPVILARGTARGKLMGGNLQTLASLVGTPWEIDLGGAILVLEEVDEAPYRIDRLLSQLILAGRCQGVVAVALGRFLGCYEHGENEVIDVLEERLSVLRVPVLYGLPIGHLRNVTTWCQGSKAVLDAHGQCLRVLERGVR